ncbi:MAG: porin [Geminicoccaceae bacterium]|nr:MAG: porin [Geminicoccaceae bacterium]
MRVDRDETNASGHARAPLGLLLLLAPLWLTKAAAVAAPLPAGDPTLEEGEAEERVLEAVQPETPPRRGLPPLERTLEDGTTIRLYGHINWGVLVFDDGRETNAYAPIDNANSASRLGLLIGRDVADWTLGGRVEVQYAPYSTSNVNVLNNQADFGTDQGNIRWIEVSAAHDRYGKLSAGQGSMATDGITMIDFAGTSVVAYSAVGDSAGAQYLRFRDPARPIGEAPRIGGAFQGFDGPRRVRVRYDTPTWHGLGATVAYGRELLTTRDNVREDDLVDIALTYGATIDDVRLGAGLGYFWDRNSREILSGSAAILHLPTGLSLAVAAAHVDIDRNNPTYGYVKAGWQQDLVSFGSTAFSLDFYTGDDIVRDGSKSRSYGAAVVQRVDDFNSELWLSYRLYDYDEPEVAFRNSSLVFAGVRFRF